LRLADYGKVILKYKLEHLFTKQILKNIGFIRNFFKIDSVSGPLPYRIRKALEELGPVYIKLGQLLSTRQDLLGPSFINELKLLQDNVDPINYKLFQSKLDAITIKLHDIDTIPAAVGSVAQVYYAKLESGREVVIKIIKPGIDILIEQDFKLLKNFSHLVKLSNKFKKIKLDKIIDELHLSIKQELDLVIESNNIKQFRDNMRQFNFIKIPEVFYADKDVIILERMYGIPIDQKQDLLDQQIDIVKMLNQGLEVFFVQAFYYGFYHADPHPGNVWIDKDGNRIYLDFGIMGKISKQDRETILRLIIMLFSKRYDAVKELIKNAGWADNELDGIELQLEKIFQGVNLKTVKDLNLSRTMSDLLDLLNTYDVNTPTHLVLFIKTLAVVDGFHKTLAPSHDVIKSVIPILTKHFSRFS
jgi:ubiquinone biosynthesis protein